MGKVLRTTRFSIAAMVGLTALLTLGCAKQNDPDIAEWGNYEGQYPRSGALIASAKEGLAWTPLLNTRRVRAELKSLLPADVLSELEQMSVESPVEQPEAGFLYAYVCEAHNCPHSGELLIDIKNEKFAVVVYRIDESQDHAIPTCYSNHVKSLGEFPVSVLERLSLANIAKVKPDVAPSGFPCQSNKNG